MFYEQIGEFTRAHLMTHLSTYLAEQQANFSDKLPVVMPKYVEVSSVLGGVVQIARDTLPQYGIDITGKSSGFSTENLWVYDYTGQIVAMVGGNSSDQVDKLIKRHAAALERYLKNHMHLHQHSDSDGFTIIGWQWSGTAFSGAMQLEREESSVGEFWVAAAQLDVTWQTSEDGFGDV